MATPAACRARGLRTVLLHTIIWLLFWLGLLCKWALYSWHAFKKGARKPKPGGSNPSVPTVLGIIIAEDNVADISLRTVANIAAWCMSYGVEHLHLYDPSGQLKRSQQVLAHDLALTAAKEGRTVVIKSGWSSRSSPCSIAQAADSTVQQPMKTSVPVQLTSGRVCQLQPHYCTAANSDTVMNAGNLSSEIMQQQEWPDNCHTQQRKQSAASHKACHKQPIKSNSMKCSGSAGNITSDNSSGPAVAVRLLAAEDAYEPVLNAVLERCAPYIIPGSSPKANSIVQQLKGKHPQNSSTPNKAANTSSSSLQHCVSLDEAENASFSQDSDSESLVSADEDIDLSSSSCSSSSQVCCGDSLPASCSSLCDADASAAVDDCECLLGQVQQPCSSCQAMDKQGRHGLQNETFQKDTLSDKQQDIHQRDQDHKQQQQQQRHELHELQKHKQQSLYRQQQQLAQLKLSLPIEQQQHEKQHSHQQDGSMLKELAQLADAEILQEPQLLLVYGPVLSLAGYPPFHTRVCEVQHMGQLAKASRQAVADAIAAYCKVLQRHGA